MFRWYKSVYSILIVQVKTSNYIYIYISFIPKKQNKTKQAKKQNKTKQNKTKQNKTKTGHWKRVIFVSLERNIFF